MPFVALDDLHGRAADLLERRGEPRARIAAVHKAFLHGGERLLAGRAHRQGTVPVRDVGRRGINGDRQPEYVHRHVDLDAGDLLPGVVTLDVPRRV